MKHLYTLPTALLLFVIVFISGCGENCTECCDTKLIDFGVEPGSISNLYYEQFNGTLDPTPTIFYYYLGGTPQRVQFFIGQTNSAICTNEHLALRYYVTTNDTAFDRPVKIFGEVYWSIFSDEVLMVNDVLIPNHEYSAQLNDVGLKQAFPEGAASVDVYVTVEFESLGSLVEDSQWLQTHFLGMAFTYDYKEF